MKLTVTQLPITASQYRQGNLHNNLTKVVSPGLFSWNEIIRLPKTLIIGVFLVPDVTSNN